MREERISPARALPAPLADYPKLRDDMKGLAIFSMRLEPGGGELVVLTQDKGRVVRIADTKSVLRAGEQLVAALRAGEASGGAKVTPKLGDSLRRQLIDPFLDDLIGVGRYLIVADGPLRELSLAGLPEQQQGLRFLADVRTVTQAMTVAELRRPAPEAPAATAARGRTTATCPTCWWARHWFSTLRPTDCWRRPSDRSMTSARAIRTLQGSRASCCARRRSPHRVSRGSRRRLARSLLQSSARAKSCKASATRRRWWQTT